MDLPAGMGALARAPALRREAEGGGEREAQGRCRRHAFIIKVSWDALQHLEVLKRTLLREYVGIAHARKLTTLPC